MARNKTAYICAQCGASHNQWSGQCKECAAWNSLEEVKQSGVPRSLSRISNLNLNSSTAVESLNEVKATAKNRIKTNLAELDRVLGGGLVAGSVVLIGGDPGIGKSTLLLQCLSALASKKKTFYVTGEESLSQVALRAQRLGLGDAPVRSLAETSIENLLAKVAEERPDVLVIDSIQTVHTQHLTSAPGSVAQVRECAAILTRYAKLSGCVLFLVGHVTKEGVLAGPRVLEHMVDTVLYFEGDAGGRYRMLRAVKNRFGAVNELGIFAMLDDGLHEVNNPSAIFLSRPEQIAPGSTVLVTREGTRPLLLEIQALVDESRSGNPRRVTLGLDQSRLSMVLAVLHRHGGVAIYDHDVFVNVVGGVRVVETASDVPVALAMLSSFRNRPLPQDLAAFGEIGLAGEIRPVPNGEERIKEAAKHGFKRIAVPKANMPRRKPRGIEVIGAAKLKDFLYLV